MHGFARCFLPCAMVAIAGSSGASGQSVGLLHYTRVVELEKTAETSANISFGDLDRDGNLDIVLAKGRHWPLVDRVLLGDGKGGVRRAYDLGPASDRSYSARLVDVDGDGSLDVVISNDAPDPKRVYLNDGKGHFRAGSTYGHPEWETRNANVADMNGDGLPDIVVANRSNRPNTSNYICFNRGGGRFDADCAPVVPYSTTTITPADMNGDGLMDLVAPHRDGGQSYVHLAGARGTFSAERRIPFGPPKAGIRISEVADFNGDGLSDIVAVDEESGVAVYFQERGGRFAPAAVIAGPAMVPYALAVADLNDDKKADVIVGHVEAPSTVFFNDGSGRHFTAVPFGDDKGTVYGFAVGDVNKDGIKDIGVARSEATNVLFFGSRHAAEKKPK